MAARLPDHSGSAAHHIDGADMNHGIWATWYGLADGDRDKLLSWLHGRIVRYTMHTPGSPTVGQRIWPPAR
jgi:hypothetical protein